MPIHTPDLFSHEFWLRFREGALADLGQAALILLLYLGLRALIGRVARQILIPAITRGSGRVDPAQAARLRTLAGLVNSIVNYALTFVAGVMLLRCFDLDPIPLLTTASVAGLAIGFGAQKLVKDVISGFFILLENQYAVGDYVTIGTVTGTVEEMGMRTTRLRDDAGRLYVLSNGDISQVCNQSRGPVAAYLEIGVAPGTDLDKARAVIEDAGKELAEGRADLGFSSPPAAQGLMGMDAAKITLRVACPVTAPARLADAQAALRDLLQRRLAESKITVA